MKDDVYAEKLEHKECYYCCCCCCCCYRVCIVISNVLMFLLVIIFRVLHARLTWWIGTKFGLSTRR